MQYNTEKFLIVKEIKTFILELEEMLVNFPKKEFLNKDMIYKEALNALELVYLANETKDLNQRKSYQINLLVKINMLDFYIERAYKKKYINEKQCLNKSSKLEKINKMIYKWIQNERVH